MPVPKRKKTKSRTRSRKAHWRNSMSVPPYAECSQCHQPKLPHRACANCGTYAGRQALLVE